jgi:hypothetical protein
MNLHSFSEVNNYEMGIFLDSKRDKQAYNDCLQEIELIRDNSSQIRIQKQEENIKYSREEFRDIWIETTRTMFSNKQIDVIDNYLSISDFPIKNITFETSYGIATFRINLPDNKCYDNRDLYSSILGIPDYRIFWNGPYYNKIHLYWAKKKEFNTIKEELKYCKKGLLELINILSKCNFK